ncbi:hypothetical protein [Rhodoflexus caldus]|uniref:hypothetical protein n=1 Tax=Rhodoflexus caldus TaxID=2891236 RepID=UPI00202ABF45|nr:hypothetical protein [Rhodoflexus caldus]
MATLISSFVRQFDTGEPASETIIPPPGRKIRKIEMRIGTGPFTEVPVTNPFGQTITWASFDQPVLINVCTVAAPALPEFNIEVIMGVGGQIIDGNTGTNLIRQGADFRPRFVPFSNHEIASIWITDADGANAVQEAVINPQNHTVVIDNITAPKRIYVAFRRI